MWRLSLPMPALLFMSLQLALPAAEAAAPPPPGGVAGADVADLQDQLEKGLRARLPSEFGFIAQVVQMVEDKQLPIELVKSTFEWVRRAKQHKRSLVPYFERALRLRAARLGIDL